MPIKLKIKLTRKVLVLKWLKSQERGG